LVQELVAIATTLEQLKKEGDIVHLHPHVCNPENLVMIRVVVLEIIGLLGDH